jgi:hypothetical protein
MPDPSAIADLEAQLLDAHVARDHRKLVELYTLAADQKEAEQDVEATCFFLTHAFIFALESGHKTVSQLNQRLVAYGREEPL